MEEIQVQIDPDEEISIMNIDETDFKSFTLGQKIRHLEVEGFVVRPDGLDAEHMDRLKSEMADAPV